MPSEPRAPSVTLARRLAFGFAALAVLALLVLPKPWSLASGPGLVSPSGAPSSRS